MWKEDGEEGGGAGMAGMGTRKLTCQRLIGELIFVQSGAWSKLETLESSARDFELEADDDFVDPKRLAAVIDRLQASFAGFWAAAQKRGNHLLTGQSRQWGERAA